MAIYQLRTFADIIAAVREELGIQSTDTTAVVKIKRDINVVYQELTAEKNWWWLEGHTTLQLPAYISAGTVNVSAGSASITFSTAPGQSQKGKLFAVDGTNDIYIIESHSAGSTSAKLSELYTGSTNTTASYKLWTDRIPLPTDCKETTEVWHNHHSESLEGRGRQDFRRITLNSPKAEGEPRFYYTGDYVDPSITSSITSLPAVSSRASAGVVKTLVFASGLPSALVSDVTDGEPVRLHISGAGHPSYNGDVIISSITTTTTTNDTIKYTGKAEYQESATSDTSISVTRIDQEADYDRYRELYLFPSLSSTRITLHVDYVKEIFPLEYDSDEPAIPVQYRAILVYGALHRTWTRNRNPEEAARNLGLYQNKLAKMAGKLQDTHDKPKLMPSKIYLGQKRQATRRLRGTETALTSFGGGSSGQETITGTASTVAIFNDSGELEGSSTISTTELGYLNGASSNIQTQLDAITTLADGKIYIGNSSNVATEVTPSGDITISNTGTTAITAGAIVNADINASAAIAHSKLANITAASILMGNGSNVPTATAVTGDVTINSSGVTAIGSGVIVNADVNASAAIERSKLASGTASHVLVNDGSGVMSSEASLAVSRGGTGAASLTANNVILGNGTAAVQFVAPGSSGNILTSNGTTWTSSAPASISESSQAQMEAAADSTTTVTPRRVNYHPGVAKVWARITIASGTPTLNVSHNVSSITDVAVGTIDVNFTTSFSSADYTGLMCQEGYAAGLTGTGTATKTASKDTLITRGDLAAPGDIDGSAVDYVAYGDQ
jgi:hypothetical protein